MAKQSGVHPSQIQSLNKGLLEGAAGLFRDQRRHREAAERQVREAELYEPIRRLQMGLEWEKKSAGFDWPAAHTGYDSLPAVIFSVRIWCVAYGVGEGQRPAAQEGHRMVTLSVQLDDRLAEIVREIAAAQERSESAVVSEAVALYAERKRPLPKGMGKYRSGTTDTSAKTRTILRDAARSGQWP
ncbi:MAG: hypothetical protein KJ000_30590 [Pirellulaceae bacterium]|nr:hypothetical protein [Pirellulaceae bacterium]